MQLVKGIPKDVNGRTNYIMAETLRRESTDSEDSDAVTTRCSYPSYIDIVM